MSMDPILFMTLVRSEKDKHRVRVLIESIRRFGGLLGQCPICCFETNPRFNTQTALSGFHVQVLPLSVPDNVKHYLFADKVFICAQVEKMSAENIQSLIWIDPGCLVLKPPVLYELEDEVDVAVRPVHIRNIGILKDEPLNGFWEKVVHTIGADDIYSSVETFVGGETIHAYFNSHAFSVNPRQGLLQKWFTCFESLVTDKNFQETSCADQLHQVFLHQAIFSALVATLIKPERLRILPPTYNYPYNLQKDVPVNKQAKALNSLVSVTTENRSLDPDEMTDIEIHEPLKTWLKEKIQQAI